CDLVGAHGSAHRQTAEAGVLHDEAVVFELLDRGLDCLVGCVVVGEFLHEAVPGDVLAAGEALEDGELQFGEFGHQKTSAIQTTAAAKQLRPMNQPKRRSMARAAWSMSARCSRRLTPRPSPPRGATSPRSASGRRR